MSSETFTREEMEEAGWEWGDPLPRHPSVYWLSSSATPVHATLIRLALAHPERAHLALGDGWSVELGFDGSDRLIWRGCGSILPLRRGALLVYSSGEATPEFDAALARARRIAEAWKAITEDREQDPADPAEARGQQPSRACTPGQT